MCNLNSNNKKYRKRSILNVGLIVYISMILYFFALYKNGFMVSAILLSVGYVGAVIGNIIRLYALPDMYFTDGSLWGSVKRRFFWENGPQLIGYFIAVSVMYKKIKYYF